MRDDLGMMCDDFLRNVANMKKTLGIFQYSQMYDIPAYMYLAARQEPNQEMIQLCEEIIKENTDWLSSFRSNGKQVFVTCLALSRDPGAMMSSAIVAYEKLRGYFSAGAYLPLLAIFMSERIPPENYVSFVQKTHSLFRQMKRQHMFMTGTEDVVFAGLIAMHGEGNIDLADSEECYQALSKQFTFHGNAMQTVGHSLSLCMGTPLEKTQRTLELYDMLEEYGIRYGCDFDMVALAVLANCGIDLSLLAADIADIVDYLDHYGHYGIFNKRSRYFHAALIANAYHAGNVIETTSAVVVSGLMEIARQQAAAAAAAAA